LINKFIDDGMITIKKRKIIIKDFESLGERLQTIF